MAIHEGSCHCGKIEFTVDGDIDAVIDCNCSMCRRRGSLLAFFPRSAMVLKTADADIATYTFNKHAIRHRFCEVCGCAPFGEANDPKRGHTVALNVRCIPALDLSTIEVKKVDGRSL